MNFSGYEVCDFTNGEGARVVLWLSGCTHNCSGCFSPSTHNPKSGEPFTGEDEDTLMKDLDKPFIAGLTFSGGDPLHKRNYKEVLRVCKKIKEKLPTKTIWLYTGYTLQQVQDDTERSEVLKYVDVLVDGKYNKDLPSAQWVGSSNQRVINIKELNNGC
jgi:anaerobic ribonucleoside-triphosphate reductase activating protein